MSRLRHQHVRVRFILAAVAVASYFAGPALAATAEQQCQQSRYTAGSKYAACQQKAAAKFYGGGLSPVFEKAAAKCTLKYVGVWARLQAKAAGTGSSCDNPRLGDNGDGTVVDRLTGLTWEQKTNLDAVVNLLDPHDGDNQYYWGAFGPADGDAYTSFLPALNGACFGGQCDWRLPTLLELQTVAALPCAASPCIDATLGPTSPNRYWTGTTVTTAIPDAWAVEFNMGVPNTHGKNFFNYVRAVHGGL